MDVHAIRLRNLKLIVAQIAARGSKQKDAATALNMSASYLSQLLGGKLMGSGVARKIEHARGLSDGWMDTPKWGVGEDQAQYSRVSQSARFDATKVADVVTALRLVYKRRSREFDIEAQADEFVEAYEMLDEMGEATPAKQIEFGGKIAEMVQRREIDRGNRAGAVTSSDARGAIKKRADLKA